MRKVILFKKVTRICPFRRSLSDICCNGAKAVEPLLFKPYFHLRNRLVPISSCRACGLTTRIRISSLMSFCSSPRWAIFTGAMLAICNISFFSRTQTIQCRSARQASLLDDYNKPCNFTFLKIIIISVTSSFVWSPV